MRKPRPTRGSNASLSTRERLASPEHLTNSLFVATWRGAEPVVPSRNSPGRQTGPSSIAVVAGRAGHPPGGRFRRLGAAAAAFGREQVPGRRRPPIVAGPLRRAAFRSRGQSRRAPGRGGQRHLGPGRLQAVSDPCRRSRGRWRCRPRKPVGEHSDGDHRDLPARRPVRAGTAPADTADTARWALRHRGELRRAHASGGDTGVDGEDLVQADQGEDAHQVGGNGVQGDAGA